MHELALLQELCALAAAAAEEQGASQIHRMELRVGELGGLTPRRCARPSPWWRQRLPGRRQNCSSM